PTYHSISTTAPPPSATYTLSLHDALPILLYQMQTLAEQNKPVSQKVGVKDHYEKVLRVKAIIEGDLSKNHSIPELAKQVGTNVQDRKSTRLNSSHVKISYAVFCLKKKKKG